MGSDSTGSRGSGAVFRRRRALVAVVALMVLAAILTVWTRVVGLGASGGASAASVSSASVDAPACDPGALTVAAVTDKTTYATGEDPVFTIKLTNSGTVACSVDVGTSQLKLVVSDTSGTVWQSSDCATGSSDTDKYWDYVKVVQPGESLVSVGVTWDRVSSNASDCSASGSVVAAGGASYWLNASVGEVMSSSSNQAQFTLQ